MQKIKTALTSGNVLAAFAVFLALGGGAFAATKLAKNSVTSRAVKDSAIQGKDVKDDSLTGADVNEATLQLKGGANGPSTPTGPAGGDLTGTYPNPEVAANAVTGNEVKDSSLTGADLDLNSVKGAQIDETSLEGVASAVQGGTGRYGFDGSCNPDSGQYVPCSVVQLPLSRPGRVLVTGTARAQIEPGKQIGFGYCRIGTTSGPVDASTIAVRTDADAGGFENVTLTAVTGVFPAGTHSFGIDCSESDALYPISFSHARVTAVALSAN
jgi:hypothetical protein